MISALTAQAPWIANAVIVGVLGVLIASRRSRNPIGWLLLAIAVGNAINVLADFIAMRGLLSGASVNQAGVEWPAWIFSQTGGVGAFLLAILVFFFPDGKLPGPGWRWVAWATAVVSVVLVVTAMFSTASTQLSPRLPNVPNPLAVGSLAGLTSGPITNAGPFVLLGMVLCAVVVRFRHSRGAERTQAQMVCLRRRRLDRRGRWRLFRRPCQRTSGGRPQRRGGFAFGLAIAVPVTIGLAVMKNGLYDIDVFISRTLVYGSLAVFITAVYVGIAVGIGTLVGSGGKPNLGAVDPRDRHRCIGFQPVRERVQKVANRLVYGKRATPYEVLRNSRDASPSIRADEVLPRMARVLSEGTGAESPTVWLRGAVELRAAATFPPRQGDTCAVA